MVHGYHVILAAYGFWLPNDPRGSWSDFVGKWELVRFGRTTKALDRRGTLITLTDVELREREMARESLKLPAVHFTEKQIASIAEGFAKTCDSGGYTIWACSLLPEHAHLVIARHRYKVEQVANLLKGGATRRIVQDKLHPLARFATPGDRPPRMWAEHQWKVYLDSEEAIENAIAYVNDNPIREGKPPQQWSFIQPFTGLEKSGWVTYH